jgi:hypothetical protein
MASEDENQSGGKAWEYPDTGAAPAKPPTIRQELTDTVREVTHPREPPRSRVADDLLMLFGRLAALILFLVVMLTALLAVLRPEKDLNGVYNLINTQLSLIIGAVLGYAAHPVEKERD